MVVYVCVCSFVVVLLGFVVVCFQFQAWKSVSDVTYFMSSRM